VYYRQHAKIIIVSSPHDLKLHPSLLYFIHSINTSFFCFCFFFLPFSFHLIFPFGIDGRINPSWSREEEWLVAAFILGYLHRAVIDYDDINATCA